MSDNKATVRLDLDASDFDKEAQNVEASAGAAEQAIEKIGRASKSATQYIQQNVAALKQLQAASKQYSGQSSPIVDGKRAVGPQVYAPAPSVNTDILRGFQVEQLAVFNKELKATQSLTKQHTQALDEQYSSLSNTRYALYDVASTYRMVGLAATAALAAQVANSAEMEAAFTGVERTVDIPLEKMGQLRDGLIELSRTIPESFTDIANIATIGGQLDVAGEHIESFSENVAKFASMTDASIDNTAMSFGRIDQLANSGAGSYDNIASAIYNVGVQTVATESQILKMSEEISATAALAGYSAQEIIGLAGALSSLAVQPERARGAIEQTFRAITNAVDSGGDKLQIFANLSGQTADAFAEQWRTAPSEAFAAFVRGLSQADNMNLVLDQLGLSGLRVTDMLKRLANNQDVLTASMGYANDAWSDHSNYLDAYDLVADDLSSQMKMLVADIRAIMDAFTDNAALTTFVELLRGVLHVINMLVNVPVLGKFFGGLTSVLLGVVAAATLVKAGLLTLQAGTYALMTAQRHLQGSTFSVANALKMLAGQFVGLNYSMDQTTGKMVQVGAASRTLGKGLLGMVGGWPGVLVTVGIGALGFLGSKLRETKNIADEVKGSFSGLASALAQDTATYNQTGEAITRLTYSVDGQLLAIDNHLTAQGELEQSLQRTASGFDYTRESVDTFTVALGTNAQQAIVSAISSNVQLQEVLTQNKDALDAAGVSAEGLVQALMEGSMDEYLATLQDISESTKEVFAGDPIVLDEAWVQAKELADSAGVALEALLAINQEFEGELKSISSEADLASAAMDYLGMAALDAESDLDGLANSTANLADTMFGAEQDIANFEAAMYNLGGSLYENGEAFDAYSEAGRANLSALMQVVNVAAQSAGNDVNALANMLAQALQAIGGTGTEIGRLFAVQAQSAVDQLAAFTNQATVNVAALVGSFTNQSVAAGYAAKANAAYSRSNSGAGRSARNTAKNVASATKEIRTLTDYVKDLSSVMKSAFEIRWGLQQSVDGVADAFQKLQDMRTDAIDRVADAFDNLADSRQKIVDLRLELASLNADLNNMSADRGTLEYQLKVAQDYGDSLREKEILAQMEKLQQDVGKAESDRQKTANDLVNAQKSEAAASKELSDAQRDVKRDLSGSTASSREQRSAVLDLVQSYQDQVTELANSGLSQQQLAIETEKLRQKFIAQMQQLGYNRAEAEKYSRSFQDMTTIINKIPRNITISANANPAQRAIDEFMAKNSKGRGASGGISVPVTPRIGRVNTGGLQRQLNNAGLTVPIKPRVIKDYIPGWATGMIGSVFYRGGFTGRGGKYDTAGIVHRGEYVIPKEHVDQSTGLPYLSALGDIMQGSRASRQSSSMSAAMPTSMVVELSPTDRKLISDGGTAVVVLDGKVIASSVNSNNANSSRRGA